MGRFSELIGTCPAIGHWLTILRMRHCMKAILYAQFQPVKTMKQFISDRSLFRTFRSDRHVSCNRALVDNIENETLYESHPLRAIPAGEDHEAVHQRPQPVSHARARHAARELVLLAVNGAWCQETANPFPHPDRFVRPLPAGWPNLLFVGAAAGFANGYDCSNPARHGSPCATPRAKILRSGD